MKGPMTSHLPSPAFGEGVMAHIPPQTPWSQPPYPANRPSWPEWPEEHQSLLNPPLPSDPHYGRSLTGYFVQMLTALLMVKLAERVIAFVPVLCKLILFCLFMLICGLIAAFN